MDSVKVECRGGQLILSTGFAPALPISSGPFYLTMKTVVVKLELQDGLLHFQAGSDAAFLEEMQQLDYLKATAFTSLPLSSSSTFSGIEENQEEPSIIDPLPPHQPLILEISQPNDVTSPPSIVSVISYASSDTSSAEEILSGASSSCGGGCGDLDSLIIKKEEDGKAKCENEEEDEVFEIEQIQPTTIDIFIDDDDEVPMASSSSSSSLTEKKDDTSVQMNKPKPTSNRKRVRFSSPLSDSSAMAMAGSNSSGSGYEGPETSTPIIPPKQKICKLSAKPGIRIKFLAPGPKDAVSNKLRIIEKQIESGVYNPALRKATRDLWKLVEQRREIRIKFLEKDGLRIFYDCLNIFENNLDIKDNMTGVVAFVAATDKIRPQFMNEKFIKTCCQLLESTEGKIKVYGCNAISILIDLLSDGPEAWIVDSPSRAHVQSEIRKNILNWTIPRWNLTYNTLEPLVDFLTVNHTRECQLYAAWALAHVTRAHPKKYVPMLSQEDLDVIISLLGCDDPAISNFISLTLANVTGHVDV